MNSETIVMCVVALIFGMLLANMLTNVCDCKVVEGLEDSKMYTCSGTVTEGIFTGDDCYSKYTDMINEKGCDYAKEWCNNAGCTFDATCGCGVAGGGSTGAARKRSCSGTVTEGKFTGDDCSERYQKFLSTGSTCEYADTWCQNAGCEFKTNGSCEDSHCHKEENPSPQPTCVKEGGDCTLRADGSCCKDLECTLDDDHGTGIATYSCTK